MGRVIEISEAKRKKQGGGAFNELLQRAVDLRRFLPETERMIGSILAVSELDIFFRARMANALFEDEIIDLDCFLCGEYIAGLLFHVSRKNPRSWYAIDYFLEYNREKNANPRILLHGGNICFLICAIFPLRRKFRAMESNDYSRMGMNLYHHYATLSGKYIGYCMSRQFELMAEVTRRAITKK